MVNRVPEVSLYVNDAFLAHHHKPARARLRGLVRNPAIPGGLLRRLIDQQFKEVRFYLGGRREWSDEQFDTLADHPDPDARAQLAKAVHVTPEQRARLIEDPSFKVLWALVEGPDTFDLRFTTREPLLPSWAYQRLIERDARLREDIAASPHLPITVMERILADAATLADDLTDGRPAMYLGNWKPDELPPDED